MQVNGGGKGAEDGQGFFFPQVHTSSKVHMLLPVEFRVVFRFCSSFHRLMHSVDCGVSAPNPPDPTRAGGAWETYRYRSLS